MSKWFNVVLVCAWGVVFSAQAMAADEKGDKGKSDKEEKAGDKKKATWDVVEVSDDLRVVQADKLSDLQKDIEKQNKDAQAKAKKEKKPAEIKKFKVLKKGFATKEEADKYVDKLKKDREKQKDKGEKGDKAAHKPAAK